MKTFAQLSIPFNEPSIYTNSIKSGGNIMKNRKTISIAILFFALLAIMTGCGKDEEKVSTVNMGYFNNITHAQALLMKSEKSLEKSFGDGITVKWNGFNAGPAEVEALFSGDIDIGYIGPVPAITANVKSRGDVVILSGATKGGAVLVRRRGADISSVKDLSGKTVAIPQIGNTQHLNLLQLLSDNGLKPVSEGGDVTVSAVANADVANMMERGDIDAALVPEPWGATLLGQGAELVLDYNQIYMEGNYDVAVVVVRKEFMETNPELVEKFMKEHEAATAKINGDTENCIKTINAEIDQATGKSLSEDIISASFGRIGVSTELNREAVMGFANISKEQKLIPELPDEKTLFAGN